MIQQTTFLLRCIWETSAWRDYLFTAFERWVHDGASRSEIKRKLQALMRASFVEFVSSSALGVDLEQINWDQLTEFFCTCFYRKRLRRPLPDIPSDLLWEQLTDPQTRGPLSLHPQQDKAVKETVPVPLVPLEQALLALGGQRLVYRIEPDLELLLTRGEAFEEPAELVPGEPHTCHANVAQLWRGNKEIFAPVTGYALSEDGLWRQHSWLLRKQPIAGQTRLIETTLKRVKYFGVILNDTEAEAFCRMNS